MNAVPHNNSCPSVRTPREGCGEYANYWKLLIDRKMVNHKTGKVIAQKAVLPIFDSDFILGNEAKGITGILDQALNDPAVQDVVTAENMVYEKFSNWNRDINNADAEAIEEAKRVRDMAAQVAVQKTVEAGGVEVPHANETETVSNISQHAMYSLCKLSDGRRFVNVDQDQDLFDGQPKNEYAKIAKKIISRKFQGKVIGIDNKMFVNGSGVAEYGYPSKNLSNELREAKFRSAGELDNLLDAGTNFENVPDGQNGHIHPDVVDGFDWYDTLFRIGNRWFSGRVNIKNIVRGKLFKDVTQIKDCTQDIIDSYGKNPKFEFLRQSSIEMLSQPVPSVKQNFAGKEFGGASHVIFDSNQAKNVDNLNPTENPDLRYSLDRDLLRELDGYNAHGDSIGKQGKAVEKMFVQAFKEAKQDSKASIEVYPDTLVAFDNLLPKLRKFVDGTLPDKSIEQLTDELLGIVDKALDNAKGEKKAHPLIESYVGGAITLSPEQAKELKSLGYSVIQYQAMLTKALGYRAHVGVAKSVADIPLGSTLEQDYQTAYDETGDESYNVTAVGLPMDYLEKLQDGDTNYPAFESEEEREFVLYEMVTNLYEKMKANKMLDIEKAIKQDEKTATKKEGYNQGAKDAEKRMSALIESANYAYNAVAAQYEKKIQQLQQDASKARLEGEIDVAMQAAKQVGKLERQLNKSLANQAKLRKEFSTTLKEEKKSMREAFKAEKKKAVSDAELAGEIHVARQAAKQVGNLERKLQKSKEEIVGLKKKPKEAVAKERKRVAQNTAKKAIKKQIRTVDRIYAHPPFLLHSRKGLHIDIRQAQKPPMLWHRGWGWVLPLIFSLLRRRL